MKIPQVQTMIPLTNSIFANMEYDFKVDKNRLDVLFNTTYGQRNVAPLVTRIVKSDMATVDELKELGTILLSVYKNKWDRYLAIYDLTYNPIYNYHDEFTETVNITNSENGSDTLTSTRNTEESSSDKHTRTDNLETNISKTQDTSILRTDNLTTSFDSSTTDSATRTDNLTKTTDKSSESTNNNNKNDAIYAFNSTDAVNANTTTGTGTNTDTEISTVTDSGTQQNESTVIVNDSTTNSGTQTNEVNGTETDVKKETGSQSTDITSSKNLEVSAEESKNTVTTSTGEKTRSSLHSGNIGNLPTQQLIEREIKLWEWNFIETVLNDVKEMLTIPMYIS